MVGTIYFMMYIILDIKPYFHLLCNNRHVQAKLGYLFEGRERVACEIFLTKELNCSDQRRE